jgi:hypothetical protein
LAKTFLNTAIFIWLGFSKLSPRLIGFGKGSRNKARMQHLALRREKNRVKPCLLEPTNARLTRGNGLCKAFHNYDLKPACINFGTEAGL